MMMRFDRRAGRALALGLVLALSTPSIALAQAQFPSEKLDSFVAAAISVEQLIQEWSPKIEGAADQQAAESLRQQANEELAQAIERTDGITVDEYRQIAQAARTDPGLSQRLQEIYLEKTGG